jgi:N-carbamoyl-L-amino-acid hydrolase
MMPTVEPNTVRLLENIQMLGEIGKTDQGGCRRIALTSEDALGRAWIVAKMHVLGMEVRVDQIGNIFGIRHGTKDIAPVMTGSHIDTVGNGGKYDGCYGVIAGLELVETLNDAGVQTPRPIVVSVFTNEEGVRFTPDMMGSLVYVGGYALQEALDSIGTDGARLGDVLKDLGYAGEMTCGEIVPHAFIELHIEQGPVLEAEKITIGVVEDLQGISWTAVQILGQANHAGTTPMRMRHDAAYVAGQIVTFVRNLAISMGGSQVCTVGSIKLKPNLVNVVPGLAEITVDLRNTNDILLRQSEERIQEFLEKVAKEEGVKITTQSLVRFGPVKFNSGLVETIESVATSLGYSNKKMTSGAGHDAQMMARICPTAMIFVPSEKGISHNPAEYTNESDINAGARVFFQTMMRLAYTV